MKIHGFHIPAIFKALIWNKFMLIFGTFCLAGAWMIQTFLIEPNKEKVEEINKDFQNYHRVMNSVSDDQFHYSVLDVFDKKMSDTISHTNKLPCLVTWYSDYCLLKHTMFTMTEGLDSIEQANDIYRTEMRFGKRFFSANKIDSLLGLIQTKKGW